MPIGEGSRPGVQETGTANAMTGATGCLSRLNRIQMAVVRRGPQGRTQTIECGGVLVSLYRHWWPQAGCAIMVACAGRESCCCCC